MPDRRDTEEHTEPVMFAGGTAAGAAAAARAAVRNPARVASLHASGLLDAAPDEVFDKLTRLSARLLGVPVTFLSLIDVDRDVYKSSYGLGQPSDRLHEHSGPTICHYAVASPSPLVIPEVAADPRYRDLHGTRTMGIAAYIGVPVEVDGKRIGCFAAIDTRPRQWTGDEVETFTTLATSAQREIELRVARLRADDAATAQLRSRTEVSEALARQLFTLSPVPKWVFDAETLAFLDVNEAAIRHYQYTREEFLAMTIRDIRPPEDIPRMLAHAHALHPEGQSHGVFRHRVKSGAIIEVEVFLRDVPYEGRRAVIAVVQDVTERRRAEHALEEASRAAAAARDAAEAANAAKSQFLSTMSHELRTPLNAIAGYTDLLLLELRGPLTEHQRADLARIALANQHITALVTDILNFARIDAGQIEYHLVDVDLASLVSDVESLIGPQLHAKGIHFQSGARVPTVLQSVRADPEKLRQILLNLLGNAVKFTAAGGSVSFVCEPDTVEHVVRIRVRDTGRGIAPEQLERIFEPFVQVDRHRMPDSQQGVGLGLSISRELARGMGGEITLESAPGAGSTFTLVLPGA
ncbi:MAG TPA: ATP-binding protein [Gemmatimonas sp.]|nr:ATP-binding protein [Gemmatimonas sp.]